MSVGGHWITLRPNAARTIVVLALLGLVGGLAERSTAANLPSATQASQGFLNLRGLSSTVKNDLVKLETKVTSTSTSLTKLQRSLPKTYLKISSANTTFLKTTVAAAQYLTSSVADQKYLPASAAGSFIQGSGSVVSGALQAVPSTPAQLLSLPGATVVVSISDNPGPGPVITIHNGTPNTLTSVVDGLNVSPTGSFALPPSPDAHLQLTNPTAEARIQIFPSGTFSNVVTIIISTTTNPSGQVEAVAQAFSGGV